jgi:hypothetical protein
MTASFANRRVANRCGATRHARREALLALRVGKSGSAQTHLVPQGTQAWRTRWSRRAGDQ